MLNKADFNIFDFQLIDKEISQSLIEELSENGMWNDSLKNKLLKNSKQLLFIHKTESESFPVAFGMESTGIRSYFRLARLLFDLEGYDCICMEDELDDSLHYDILIYFLQIFLQTNSHSQLIFTTHNQMLLSEDWMLRRDMVWFTEKEKNGATILYTVAGLGLHKNLSILNAYKTGKLGAKPQLGSTLI